MINNLAHFPKAYDTTSLTRDCSLAPGCPIQSRTSAGLLEVDQLLQSLPLGPPGY